MSKSVAKVADPHIVECANVEFANQLLASGEYRLLDHDRNRGYILVRRVRKSERSA
jgi:hypothetical protein